jgi:hypothetical protein
MRSPQHASLLQHLSNTNIERYIYISPFDT